MNVKNGQGLLPLEDVEPPPFLGFLGLLWLRVFDDDPLVGVGVLKKFTGNCEIRTLFGIGFCFARLWAKVFAPGTLAEAAFSLLTLGGPTVEIEKAILTSSAAI